MLRNDDGGYGLVAQVFHWAIVGLIVLQFVLAWRFEDLELSPAKIGLIAQHKSFGMTIFILALLRLGWRLTDRTPALPGTLKPYERSLARITHWGLYALILLMPLTGLLMSSLANMPVSWFGLFSWPDLVSPSEEAAGILEEVHETLASALVLLALIHVAAVVKHVVVYRDGTLQRMLPWRVLRR